VLEIVAKHPDACGILERVSADVDVSHPKEAWTAAQGDYEAALDAVTLAARSVKSDPIRQSFQQLFDAVQNAHQRAVSEE